MTRTRILKPIYTRRGTYQVFKRVGSTWVLIANGNNNTVPPEVRVTGSCIDDLHPYPYLTDGPLTINRKDLVPIYLNGETRIFPNNLGVLHYVSYKGYCASRSTNSSGVPTLPSPSNDYWITKALANLNLSRPVVDLPLFIFEFKDFPRMLKGLGQVLSGKIRPDSIPNGHLAYQFGWKPLFSDLMNLLNLADSIEDRKRLLMNAMKKGGTRVNRSLGSFDLARASYGDPFIWESPVANGPWTIAANVNWDGYEKAWYTARLSVNPNSLPSGNLETIAARAVLGLNLSASTLWNMLPWSWLIDYFTNVGDMLNSSRGYIPFQVKRLNVMVYQEYKRSLAKLPSHIEYGGGGGKVTRKNRVQSPAIARLAFKPFLTNGQLANLAALIMARALK